MASKTNSEDRQDKKQGSVILSEAPELVEGAESKNSEVLSATDTAQTHSTTEPFTLKSQTAPVPVSTGNDKHTKQPSPEEASQSPFSITVGTVYDGPLDLLLDLIRKQNIDIYDIPIARITAQFLDYTKQLQQADVDAAGEFIYVASLLIHIKSKMLLPRDPLDVAAGNDEDPRRELVERLLEHERFKAAAQMLQQKQMLEDASWSQPGMQQFLADEGITSSEADREIDATTIDLVTAMADVFRRALARPIHEISEDTVTVAQMIDFVRRRLLMEDKPISLRKLLHNTKSERALICTFLAMLELVRLQAILLRQSEQQGDILIKKTVHFEQVFSDQAAVRDDWS